jgi:hypothetical protein
MIKRVLPTSVYLSSLLVAISMPLQATQPHHMPGNTPSHQSGETSHCPPCPCMGGNGGMGWVLIPYGSMLPGGTPCDPKHETGGEHPGNIHEPTHPLHEPTHPHPTKPLPHHHEDDDLENHLKNVRAKLYLRNNPHNGQEEKEWGKEWQGKVYFRELGKWVNHPVLPETGNEPAHPGRGEPAGNIQEPKGTGGGEQPRQAVDTQAAISKAPRALHSKDGQSRWTRFLKENGMDKWFVQENGQWVLWDEQPSGQKQSAQSQQGNIQEREKPNTGDVIPSMTIRNTQRGPGTYNPILPGAPGSGITSPNVAPPAGE